MYERIVLTDRVCWLYPLEGKITQESIGLPQQVKLRRDVNGLIGGLTPLCGCVSDYNDFRVDVSGLLFVTTPAKASG